MSLGKIRVGTCSRSSKNRVLPIYEGYNPIFCLTPSTPYGSLGPYDLYDSTGRMMENIWQFSKVYPNVEAQKQINYSGKVIWTHPPETHCISIDDEWYITKEYIDWRDKGFYCNFPIRYPPGFRNMNKCLFALETVGSIKDPIPKSQMLNYVDARKKIYLPNYNKLVVKKPQFKKLKDQLVNGTNLLIIEVDGPVQSSLDYYKEKYNVDDEFIQQDSMEVTVDNLKIMLNDTKHPFGHGYCLAAALLEITNDLISDK